MSSKNPAKIQTGICPSDMKQVSDNDYKKILRLLYALSKTKGENVREKENSRKAYLLHKKLVKKYDISNTDKL